MKGRLGRQVNPAITAITILVVLVVVQWAWWRGLVARPKAGPGAAGGPPPPGSPVVTVYGRPDVLVETLSGDPQPGDADGAGRDARFDGPTGLAIDRHGNLYVADTRNARIRRVAPDGETTTVAGSEPGYADGPALQARFNAPCGVAVTPDGTIVYVADTGNGRIRRIAGGQVTTLPVIASGPAGAAAPLKAPTSLALVPKPEAQSFSALLVIADSLNRRLVTQTDIGRWAGSVNLPGVPTGVALPAGSCAVPGAGEFRSAGQTFRAIPIESWDEPLQPGALRIRRPVAILPAAKGCFVTGADDGAVLYAAGGQAHVIAGWCTAGLPLTGFLDATGDKARFGYISAIVSDGGKHLYVADTTNNAIRRLTLPDDVSQPVVRHRSLGADYWRWNERQGRGQMDGPGRMRRWQGGGPGERRGFGQPGMGGRPSGPGTRMGAPGGPGRPQTAMPGGPGAGGWPGMGMRPPAGGPPGSGGPPRDR